MLISSTTMAGTVVSVNMKKAFTHYHKTIKSQKKMQEIIVISIALAALGYLFVKFFAKGKSHNCDKCGLADNEPKED